MKVFRFMSKEEFEKYKNNETLKNTTKHKAKTNSIGFCFLNIEDFTPEMAMHFLSGIVSFDICAVFETKKKLKKTFGIYASPPEHTDNAMKELIEILIRYDERITIDEYCTTQYDKETMKLIKYSENLWKQWGTPGEQKEIKWEVVNDK